jgi:hypothetical protein
VDSDVDASDSESESDQDDEEVHCKPGEPGDKGAMEEDTSADDNLLNPVEEAEKAVDDALVLSSEILDCGRKPKERSCGCHCALGTIDGESVPCIEQFSEQEIEEIRLVHCCTL